MATDAEWVSRARQLAEVLLVADMQANQCGLPGEPQFDDVNITYHEDMLKALLVRELLDKGVS